MSVKEARKLLGKRYQNFTDTEIEQVVTLLNVIAVDSVLSTVPK